MRVFTGCPIYSCLFAKARPEADFRQWSNQLPALLVEVVKINRVTLLF